MTEEVTETGNVSNQNTQRSGVVIKDNTIYVGKKPAMVYVLAAITQFNSGSKQLIIKARGKTISRAVDVAQIIMNRFLKDVKVADIKIMTEELTAEDGRSSRVSAIEIHLSK